MALNRLKLGFVLAMVVCLAPPLTRSLRMPISPKKSNVGVNGGTNCIACTVVVGLLQQIMQVYTFTPEECIDFACNLFPGVIHDTCVLLGPALYGRLVDALNSGGTPDTICYGLGECYVDEGYHYCHLFPLPEEGMDKAVEASRARRADRKPMITDNIPLCKLDGFKTICSVFSMGLGDDHSPTYDVDMDEFSTVENYRGYDWRGQDCGPLNANAYPGKLPTNSDILYDSNCNGIWGLNLLTGKPYEEELCGDQDSQGIIIIGDSIGAHFYVPPDWIRAKKINPILFTNLTFIIGNEFDWPHLSYGSGFVNSTWPITINTPTNSLYWRLRNRDLCSHRDYQNLAFNGAQSGTAQEGSTSMVRDEGNDKPVLLVYAEYGNDICRSKDGSVDQMTSVAEFHDAVVEYLDYLETRLPSNSHVVLIGLVNGTYLYDILKGRLHPLGELNHDITYDDVYDYFYCMQVVCPGWTNTNVTIQEMATNHAMELSNSLRDIAAGASYSRFDVHYQDSPLEETLAQWPGERWELIEPVDGLHPSKHGQDMFAKVLWDNFERYYPEILGTVNPNNAKIRRIFGDQGGH